MSTFNLEGQEFIELNKLLKITGLCDSGGWAKTVISDGQVKVDGSVERRKRCKIRQGQVVEFNDQKVTIE
jgi:ribosome-associated protein